MDGIVGFEWRMEAEVISEILGKEGLGEGSGLGILTFLFFDRSVFSLFLFFFSFFSFFSFFLLFEK